MPAYPQKRKRKKKKKGGRGVGGELGAVILGLFLKIFKHVSQEVACFNEIALSPSLKF